MMKRFAALLALLLSFATVTTAPNSIGVETARAGSLTLLGAGSNSVPPFPPGTFSIGATLSGLEVNSPVTPNADEINYLSQKNLKNIRIPLDWGQINPAIGPSFTTNCFVGIQSIPFGALDTTSTYLGAGGYLAAMDSVVANATSAGETVLLDIHNFGFGPGLAGTFSVTSLTASGTTVTATTSGAANLVNGAVVIINGATDSAADGFYNGTFTISNVTSSTFQYTASGSPSSSPATGTVCGIENAPVGTARLPSSAFANLWTQISTHYKTNTTVSGYDLMNEPINGFVFSNWFNAAQAAITAIRANGDTHRIYVEGVNFSGAWNWVSGEGQPYNNSTLYQLNDPLNNLVFSAHSYLDRDNSGGHFVWSQEIADPGESPPGFPTSSTIGITRLTPFVQWCDLHQVRCHIGETATSNDPLIPGGVGDYIDWNIALTNEIAYGQANNIEFSIFGGGAEFGPATPLAGYSFNYEPSSVTNPNNKDFSTTGLQSTQMVVLDHFSGFSGAQPQAYSLTYPLDGSFNPVQRATVGVPTGNIRIAYNGVISSTATITPHATLADGSSAGGTFIPATIPLAPGDNAAAAFTYTPSQAATIKISTTNDRGWFNPPPLGLSSQADNFIGIPLASLTNIYGMYTAFTPYSGPALRILRSTDAAQEDVSTTVLGPTGYLGFDRGGIQTWASARAGITILRIYDESPAANHITFNQAATFPGKISGNILTVTGSVAGAIQVGQTLLDGPGQSSQIPAGITIVSGSGATWLLSQSLTVPNEAMVTVTLGGSFPTLNLLNAAGYPEINVLTATRGEFNMPVNGATAFSSLWRINQTSGSGITPYRMDWFVGPVSSQQSTFFLNDPNNGGNLASVGLNVVNGAYHEYAVTWANAVSNGFISYKDAAQQNTATFTAPSVAVPPFFGTGLDPSNGFSGTQFGYFKFGPNVWLGSMYNMFVLPGFSLTSSQVTAFNNTDNTYYSTPLTDTLPALTPSVSNAAQSGVVTSSLPFGSVVIADQNTTPTDTVTITLTGPAGGTLAGTGLTGTGPYTIASASPASVTATLQAVRYTPAGSPTQTETMSINVVSSAGTSTTDNNTVVTIVSIAPPETPFAAPGGTFTPVNKSGVNLSGAESAGGFGYPQAAGAGGCSGFCSFNYGYPPDDDIDYWAQAGFGVIRVPVFSRRLQEFSYGAIDPAGRTDEAVNGYRRFTAPAQTNLLSLKAVIDKARADNLYVIIDVHDFGSILDTYSPTPGSPHGTFINIGFAEGQAQFADLWTRIATKFKNYDNVWFGLMNEPEQSTAALWKAGAVPAINAIAAVTTSHTVLIPGNCFTGAHDWVACGNDVAWAGYVPPAGLPIMFEMHEYFDHDFSGQNAVCTSGSGPMAGATAWARANGFKIFIGEMGWTRDVSCPPLATDFLNYLVANNDVYAGYTIFYSGSSMFYGPWNSQPANSFISTPAGLPTGPFTDAPQTILMQSNILNFLLKRDIDPGSNDNDPMWLEKAA